MTVERFTDEQAQAVTAELARLTLGAAGPERPELAGPFLARLFTAAAEDIAEAMRTAVASVRAHLDRSPVTAVRLGVSDAERFARKAASTGALPDLLGIPVVIDPHLAPGDVRFVRRNP